MAVDVVVRPEGRCVTVVADAGFPVPDGIVLTGLELEAVSGGRRIPVGVLTPAMAAMAAECVICVFVEMEGPAVKSSREVSYAVT